jgi:hypothetical protein
MTLHRWFKCWGLFLIALKNFRSAAHPHNQFILGIHQTIGSIVMKRRVVVTGMGAITPLGAEVEQLWDNVLACKSGIHLLSLIDPTPFKVKIAGDIPDFDPDNYVDPKDHKRLDRFTLFAMWAGGKAIEDSGLVSAVWPKSKFKWSDFCTRVQIA